MMPQSHSLQQSSARGQNDYAGAPPVYSGGGETRFYNGEDTAKNTSDIKQLREQINYLAAQQAKKEQVDRLHRFVMNFLKLLRLAAPWLF